MRVVIQRTPSINTRIIQICVLVALSGAMTSGCTGHKHTLGIKQYCKQVKALDYKYNKRFAQIWKGSINIRDVTPQFDRQLVLRHQKLAELESISVPLTVRALVGQYVAVTKKELRKEQVYIKRYRKDKMALRDDATLRRKARALVVKFQKRCGWRS